MNDFYNVDFDNTNKIKELVGILKTTTNFPDVKQELTRTRERIGRRGLNPKEYTDEDIIIPCFEYCSIPAFLNNRKRIGRKIAQQIDSLTVLAKGQFYLSYQREIKQYYETNKDTIPSQEDCGELNSLANDLNIDSINPSIFRAIMPALDSFNETLVIAIKSDRDMSEVQKQMNHVIGTLWD